MNIEQQQQAHKIIALYPQIEGNYQISILSGGLIHLSLLIELENPNSHQKFVLQKLHPQLSTAGILHDYQNVTAFLASKQYGGPILLHNQFGQAFSQDDQNAYWRLSTFVEGSTLANVQDDTQVYLAAKSLAHFHQVMSDFPQDFKTTHPGHDTQGHWHKLKKALADFQSNTEIYDQIAPLAHQILDQLEKVFLPINDLAKVVVHGDPKITNLRFQSPTVLDPMPYAIMLDLDTCNRHTRLVDLGDAIRSWCQMNEPFDHRFSITRYQSLVKGYLSEGIQLSDLEKKYLSKCGQTITLELASRFARDFLEDFYFAYDQQKYPSRRAHNLARTMAMFELAQEMKLAQDELDAWLETLR